VNGYGKKELAFAAGIHIVELRYKDIWDIDDDDHEDVVSPISPFSLTPGPAAPTRSASIGPRTGKAPMNWPPNFKAAIIDVRTKKAVSRLVEH